MALKKPVLALAATVATASPAAAHLEAGSQGSALAGFAHPLTGADHILAMLAVGLWAALLAAGGERRALWPVPAAFVAAMAAGFVAALAGFPLPLVEPAILASVIAIGLAAAIALRAPTGAAMAMVGIFAVFHGYAHGTEIGGAGVLAYMLGFMAATALLHAAGALGGTAFGRLPARAGGAATALAGLWLAFAA